MPIPDYQSLMLPLLCFAKDNLEHSIREAVDVFADEFKLTEQEKSQLLPSGTMPTLYNRVGWARTYMCKAGLLESPRRGCFKITQKGQDVLNQNPPRIDVNFLSQFSEFQKFRTTSRPNEVPDSMELGSDDTPEESLESAHLRLRSALAVELLQQLKSSPPGMFEKIVVDLLLKMGYGGSRKDAGQAIGKSGDEGIDGIIKEDKLGLDIIYIQAKRWENQVSRPEIQKFAGALQGKRARKGVFITTSCFSKEARVYAASIDAKLILLDGEELAELMIDYGVGVIPVATYDVKKLDSDYFSGE